MTASANLNSGQSSRVLDMRLGQIIPETSKSHGKGGRAGAILGLDNLVTTELDTYPELALQTVLRGRSITYG